MVGRAVPVVDCAEPTIALRSGAEYTNAYPLKLSVPVKIDSSLLLSAYLEWKEGWRAIVKEENNRTNFKFIFRCLLVQFNFINFNIKQT